MHQKKIPRPELIFICLSLALGVISLVYLSTVDDSAAEYILGILIIILMTALPFYALARLFLSGKPKPVRPTAKKKSI